MMSINYSQSVSFPYLVRNILYGSQKTLSFSSRIECFSLHLHAMIYAFMHQSLYCRNEKTSIHIPCISFLKSVKVYINYILSGIL